MQYTTRLMARVNSRGCFIRISKILLYAIHNKQRGFKTIGYVVLSGFQRYFCMQYTTNSGVDDLAGRCFIRISKILLYAIHNLLIANLIQCAVVLSGFQRYFCMQYTTSLTNVLLHGWLFYQDFNEQFAAKVLKNHEIYKFTRKYFDTSEKKTTFAAI